MQCIFITVHSPLTLPRCSPSTQLCILIINIIFLKTCTNTLGCGTFFLLDCAEPIRGHTLRENWLLPSPEALSDQSLLCWDGTLRLPASMLGFCLTWARAGPVCAAVVVSSYAQLPYSVDPKLHVASSRGQEMWPRRCARLQPEAWPVSHCKHSLHTQVMAVGLVRWLSG